MMRTGEQGPTLPWLKAQRGAGSGVPLGLLALLCCCVAVLLCCCVALFTCALGLACTGQSTMHMICACWLGRSIKYFWKFFAEQMTFKSSSRHSIVWPGVAGHFITINYY
jgi:hypothetical protein